MKYYIQNTCAGFLGNSIVFWAIDSRGYTPDLQKSHKFTEEEAKEICQGNPVKNKAWPVEYIENNVGIQRVIDSQFLDHKNIKQWI